MRRVLLAAGLVLLALPGVASALTWGSPVNVTSNGGTYALVSCSSASKCTVINGGYAYTFNPDDLKAVTSQVIPSVGGFAGFDCPSTSECVLAASNGEIISFDPGNPDAEQVTQNLSVSVEALSCPGTTQCTVTGFVSSGSSASLATIVTFNPITPSADRESWTEQTESGAVLEEDLHTVACPSATQCTSGDGSSGYVTFNPQDPGNASETIDGGTGAGYSNSIACPSTTQCTVVGNGTDASTFNPTVADSPVQSAQTPFAETGGMSAVGCDSTTDCVASSAGAIAGGDPQTGSASSDTWNSEGAATLSAQINSISCAAVGECVAVDADGDVITAPPPTSTVAAKSSSSDLGVLGKATVRTVTPNENGLRVSLHCSGKADAHCTFIVKLSAGVSSGPAASKTVTIKPGTVSESLVMVAKARALVKRYGKLVGRLVVSQKIYGGDIVLASRKVVMDAGKE